MGTMASPLRVVVADDERPARRFLVDHLQSCAGVEVVGEAASGDGAIALIEQTRPDLVLLDLQMPEGGGFDVVRRLPADDLPLVAFVTAFDEQAIEAFELNAIDYILKPAGRQRVREMIERARTRLASAETRAARAVALEDAATGSADHTRRQPYLERIPVKRRDEIVLLPIRRVAFVTAEAELLHITTVANERYTIAYRLHLLEARLDPRRFVRLSRGTLANIDMVARLSPMPGGTHTAILSSGQELQVSRIQSRLLRDRLFRL